MIRLLAGLILLVCVVPPAFAGLDAAAVNNAEFKGKPPADDKADPVVVKALGDQNAKSAVLTQVPEYLKA